MKIYYKLKYSETFKVDSTKHLFTQKFRIKLYRSKEFEGEIKDKKLNLTHHQQKENRFSVKGSINISCNIKEQKIELNYRLPKTRIVYYILVNLLILTSYFLDLFETTNISNPMPIWIGPISPLLMYTIMIAAFHYSLKDCKKRVKSFLLDKP